MSTSPEIVRLILEEDDRRVVEDFEAGFGRTDTLTFEPTPRRATDAGQPADAVYVSFMGGLEIGARSVFGTSQIIPTIPENRDAGWPTYTVVGIAFAPGHLPSSPQDEFSDNLRAVIEAVREFNRGAKQPIRSIRATLRWLLPQGLDVLEAGRLARTVIDQNQLRP